LVLDGFAVQVLALEQNAPEQTMRGQYELEQPEQERQAQVWDLLERVLERRAMERQVLERQAVKQVQAWRALESPSTALALRRWVLAPTVSSQDSLHAEALPRRSPPEWFERVAVSPRRL
jgi:hypothetical protein